MILRRSVLALALSAPLALQAHDAPVLVELFTSQGCSSCPEADALLSEMAAAQPAHGFEIIPLAFHVDYWNHLGWSDPFSSHEFTLRQRAYASSWGSGQIYTPQAVVNGGTGMVGHDRVGILSHLKPLKRLSLSWEDGSLHISGLDPYQRLDVAVTEDGLLTRIPRGENRGLRLPQSHVVRSLQKVSFEGNTASLALALDPSWRPNQLHAVAFQCLAEPGRVTAAGIVPLH
jgi:hypothetical protein